MAVTQDKEIQQYRDLMVAPDQFGEGFSFRTFLGAMFLGLIMLPGSIYLALVMGAGLGPAARWVTVILFAEVSRRSMKSLKQQEIFIIFYMVGIAMGGQLYGGPLTALLWNQYLAQSDIVGAMGIDVPHWVAPPAEVIKEHGRTFFTSDWMVPIFFISGMLLIGRIDNFGLGYVLHRWTAHMEKLPFPMAPAEGLGITALAETRDRSEAWKWRCFSLGGVLGLAFGFIYIGVPAITGAIYATPVEIIPIPFLDLTPVISSREVLPAMPLNLVFDLSLVIAGMVLPFWAVVGGFIGVLITLVLNPVLYRNGMLTTWTPGMGLVRTVFSNHVDFYLSFGIGLSLAIFVVSLVHIAKPLIDRWRTTSTPHETREKRSSLGMVREAFAVNHDRGDIPIYIALGIYLLSTISYILICVWMMPGDPQTGVGRFPWKFFLGFAFVYSPVMSYVNAKIEGMVGQTVQIPMVREAAFILSGYTGSTIWFAPIPINDYGSSVRQFRILELTGTRLTSLIKTELLVIPIVIVSSLVFSHFIWRLAPIPSPSYPYAEELWELNALNFALTATATLEGSSAFIEALKPEIVAWGLGGGVIAFMTLSYLGLPTFLVYGAVRGMGQSTPGNVIPEMIGALVGRFYLQRKWGHQTYKKYMMVVMAGFTAGMGLIGMGSIAIALIMKSTSTLRY